MKLVPFKFFAFMVSLAATSAFSQAYDYHRTYKSPYYLGRGDTGIAVADEQHSVFYNPAGIAQGKGIYKKTLLGTPSVAGSTASRDLARKIQYEKAPEREALLDAIGKPQHIGASASGGIFLRRAAIAASQSLQADILVSKSRETSGIEEVRASYLSDTVMGFSIGEKVLWDEFTVGTTVKIIQRSFADMTVSALESSVIKDLKDGDIAKQGDATGVDLGMMYRSGGARSQFSLGLTISDIGDTVFTPIDPNQTMDPIYQTINLGLAYEAGPGRSKIRFLLDYRDLTGEIGKQPMENLHLGAEVTMADYIGFMLGMSEGYWSGGGYIDVRFIRFDLGAYTKEVGNYPGHRPDTRFYFQLSLAI